LGYGNPRTLTDASVRNCVGDIRELKPTILVGVPAVWEAVKKGIMTKVSAGSAITQHVFWAALALKGFLLDHGLPGSGVLDSIVFNKVKDATGGRLRITLVGGGPISKETQRFLSMSIAPMIIGYGLTETTAMGVIMDPFEWTDKAIGAPTPAVEVKLVDYAEAGYFSKNNPPQGELWIRGASVMSGYWQNDEETKEAVAPGGWFKTGDICEFDHKGHIKIIDRKKNLVKTLNGEYIALEKLESTYRSVPVVNNICVYASEKYTKPVAIIVPIEPALKKLAKANGIEEKDLEELIHDKKLQKIVLNELLKKGRESGLRGMELLDGVVLADEEWTPQNVSFRSEIQNKDQFTDTEFRALLRVRRSCSDERLSQHTRSK
jgi:long-chain acyl-CoA synthetase